MNLGWYFKINLLLDKKPRILYIAGKKKIKLNRATLSCYEIAGMSFRRKRR